MKKIYAILPHILFILLVTLVLQPSIEGTESYLSFLVVIIAIELVLIIKYKSTVSNTIGIIVYLLFILWEYKSAKVGIENSILYPAPENVFAVFMKDYDKIFEGIGSSLRLLGASFGMALIFGVGFGLLVGLSEKISAVVLPIARVISPIPPIIYSPYAVALLPSFRAASIFIVTLTLFWPIFMSMVMSVKEVDVRVMDSAKTLNLKKGTLILRILLPYSLQGIINSVSVSVSTSFLALTAAEMLGGTSGLGWYIKYHSDFANFPKVVFGIIMIGIVVTALNAFINVVRKYLIRWK